MFVSSSPHPRLFHSLVPNFSEARPKDEDSIVHNDNGTVTFRNKKSFYFRREMSVGDQTDIVTTINIPVFVSTSDTVTCALLLAQAHVQCPWNSPLDRFLVQFSVHVPIAQGPVSCSYQLPYPKFPEDFKGGWGQTYSHTATLAHITFKYGLYRKIFSNSPLPLSLSVYNDNSAQSLGHTLITPSRPTAVLPHDKNSAFVILC